MNYNDRDWCQYRKGSELLNKSLLYALWDEWLLHVATAVFLSPINLMTKILGCSIFVRGNQKSTRIQAKKDLTDKADYSLLEQDFSITDSCNKTRKTQNEHLNIVCENL